MRFDPRRPFERSDLQVFSVRVQLFVLAVMLDINIELKEAKKSAMKEGKYVDLDSSGAWWAPSSRADLRSTWEADVELRGQ